MNVPPSGAMRRSEMTRSRYRIKIVAPVNANSKQHIELPICVDDVRDLAIATYRLRVIALATGCRAYLWDSKTDEEVESVSPEEVLGE
jgi:hypothetical protein